MRPAQTIDDRLLHLLVCPRDHSDLSVQDGCLCCAQGHTYPIVNGIPVFLLAEKPQTMQIAIQSLKAAETGSGAPLFLDTLGISAGEKHGIERDWAAGSTTDPAISYLVGATSGFAYKNLIGRLGRYPIPKIPVCDGRGRLLLDVGSNWGRWTVSAAQKGWRAIGIDPSLGALAAAQRAFSPMGLDISFVCGDARFLPFRDGSVECVFSYSVVQHFSEQDAEVAIGEFGRVLSGGGKAKIQLAHKGGLRAIYWRYRRDYMEGGPFRVRYWSLQSMRQVFAAKIGASNLTAETFGGLGLLAEDRDQVSTLGKLLITISTILKRATGLLPFLIRFADSVYVVAVKRRAPD